MIKGKVISVRLEEEMFNKIEDVSNNIRRSKNWVIKEVLKNHLEDLFDFEEAKRIFLDKKDEIVSHEQAKKEILPN
jgi:predicted DNA-binding protein